MAYCITQHLFDLVYSMFSCVVSPVNRMISDEFALGIILDSVSSILPTGDDKLTSLPKETSFVLFLICILCFLRSAKVPLPFMVTTTCTVTYFIKKKSKKPHDELKQVNYLAVDVSRVSFLFRVDFEDAVVQSGIVISAFWVSPIQRYQSS